MIAAFKSDIDHFVAGNEDEEDEMADSCTQDETEDYLDREIDHDVEFSCLNRVACFSHTLQLAVHKFDDVVRFKVTSFSQKSEQFHESDRKPWRVRN